MEWLFYFLLSVPVMVSRAQDPSPGIFQSKTQVRNLDCARLSPAQAQHLYPGQVPEVPARNLPTQADVMVCSQRYLPYGERRPRDEVILSSLRRSVGEIAQVVSALGPPGTLWHVDAFYPDEQVASKISIAARTELAERGQRVSDRVPVLAAGDLAVLSRMQPQEAYPLACARYLAQGSLAPDHAFLGLMIVDEKETQLHAGLCVGGEWKWLQ